MDQIYHPVSTTNPEAQTAFDKGLLAIYAFNYDQALNYFDLASRLDPNLAMAYWGMALAIDENLDKFATPNHARLTMQLSNKALELSSQATPHEQAYIKALATRFSKNYRMDKALLRTKYAEAMKEVVAMYPEDLDASTLYAESLMDLLSWDLWTPEEEPRNQTLEIVALLESVLKRNPMHIGANHYYIHAQENSPYPERALMAAYRLDQLNLMDWAHLIHTSSHIYMRVGSYDKAVLANQRAIEADRSYIKINGIEGRYPLKYLTHNLFYLTIAYMWQEQFDQAIASAKELESLVKPYVSQASSMEFTLLMPLQVYLYFHRWEDILQLPEPSSDQGLVQPFWAFAYAMACAGQEDLEKAKTALAFFQQKQKEYFAKSGENTFAQELFTLGEHLLKASIYKKEGNLGEGVKQLQQAALLQEKKLGEFSWSYPICQTLGAYLIEMQLYKEAETTFRKALNRYPRNGRSLFGLSQALKFQGKSDYSIERQCREALIHAPNGLKIKDL